MAVDHNYVYNSPTNSVCLLCVCVCVCVCVRACARARLRVYVYACLHACMTALGVTVHACVDVGFRGKTLTRNAHRVEIVIP